MLQCTSSFFKNKRKMQLFSCFP
uniref:Uncharacterized protein n=1 Tax=Lepeophtheirus salmonis TaxID=72036 RepID=A0A0K2TWJ3_LEPSM